MVEYIMRMLSIPLYLIEGYCIQFFFGRFAEPQIGRFKNMPWAAGIAWILIRIVRGALFRETDSVTLIVELLFTTVSLFVFSVGWYKGNILWQNGCLTYIKIPFSKLCASNKSVIIALTNRYLMK